MRENFLRRSIDVRTRTRIPAKSACPSIHLKVLLSRLDRDLPDHIGMKPAVILNGAGQFQHDTVLAIRSDHDVPAVVPRCRGVRDDILVVPFDRVADISRDLRRHIGNLVHRDVDDFGAHRPRRDDGEEGGKRAET